MLLELLWSQLKKMNANKILIIINIFGVIGSLIWLTTEKSLEALVTTIVVIGGLFGLIYSKNVDSITMNQKGGKKSNNFQSGRDININNKDD